MLTLEQRFRKLKQGLKGSPPSRATKKNEVLVKSTSFNKMISILSVILALFLSLLLVWLLTFSKQGKRQDFIVSRYVNSWSS